MNRITMLLLAIIILMVSGCSELKKQERRDRRAQNKLNYLLMKNPRLSRIDTVWYYDTAIVSYDRTDTVWKITNDTLFLESGRARSRTIIRHDTLTQYIECRPDSLPVSGYVTVPTVAPKETVYVRETPWWVWLIVVLLAVLVALPRVTETIKIWKQ